MQIEKHRKAAFLLYFVLLLLLVGGNMWAHIDIISMIYLMVVLCCSLKFILIVNKNKK